MPNLLANRNCVYQTAYHVVWCPKYRRPVLTGPTAEAAREILARICLEKQWPVTALEIQSDHIHIFFGVPPAISIANAVKILKGVSANKLLRLFPHLKTMLRDGHLWSPSYYVGTVGEVSAETVKRYIERCEHIAARR